jgi:HrpA-like RNA helicase
MDIELFRKYYQTKVLKVSGRMFPVEEEFVPYNNERDVTHKIIRVINERLLDEREQNLRPEYCGHILVFCLGVDQITELQKIYSKKLNPRVFKVLALHGRLAHDEQREAFAPTNEYKLIFSSRVAETSITIDGVKVVIDPGEDREMVYDQKTKVTSLKLKKISLSSAKQRAGRAGRTNKGYCFRLYSSHEKGGLQKNKVP